MHVECIFTLINRTAFPIKYIENKLPNTRNDRKSLKNCLKQKRERTNLVPIQVRLSFQIKKFLFDIYMILVNIVMSTKYFNI